jgi:hypothetical protein
VARIITDAYPSEKFDPAFQGQDLETVYFDTRAFALRKARSRSDQYLTLRIRCYQPSYVYALSAKTEGQKFRVQIDPNDAEAAISGNYTNLWPAALPGDLLARLLSIAGDDIEGVTPTGQATSSPPGNAFNDRAKSSDRALGVFECS